MGRALPEDVPIEAKMVTKAIERAQNTVEGRNAEIRKDVLKYDEVMNEQRKVIYARRLQIIDGEDLEERTDRAARARSSTDVVVAELPVRLPRGVGPRHAASPSSSSTTRRSSPRRTSLRPTTPGRRSSSRVVDEAPRVLRGAARGLPRRGRDGCAQIERDVMLQIIDQRWRDHLAEMDYLREGIHLRAMGQQDPLVAWQRRATACSGSSWTASTTTTCATSCTSRP